MFIITKCRDEHGGQGSVLELLGHTVDGYVCRFAENLPMMLCKVVFFSDNISLIETNFNKTGYAGMFMKR